MMRGHARYEALAGAIALGEASIEERRTYAAHAAACPRCDGDIDDTRTLVGCAIAGASHSERWQPFLRDDIARRINSGRAQSTRRTAFVLCCAVFATLALNVGLAERLGGAPEMPRSASPDVRAVAVAPLAGAQIERHAFRRHGSKRRTR